MHDNAGHIGDSNSEVRKAPGSIYLTLIRNREMCTFAQFLGYRLANVI